MSKAHTEWQREYVSKYSNINKMKNGLRKIYFYENDCEHDDSVEEVECPLCQTLFECCNECLMDFTRSDFDENNSKDIYDDLVCPDCLEICFQCHNFITDDQGSRADSYPYNLYCNNCAEENGVTYDSPEELETDDDSGDDNDEDYESEESEED